MSSGGNSGSQATSLIIRALALREISLRDWWRIASRELPTGLTLGAILGAIGMARILFWQKAGFYDLRNVLAARGADSGSCFDGDCHLRIADRLDASICAEADGVRSGHCVGAIRGDIGRCHGLGDLLFRRLCGVARGAPLRRSERHIACAAQAALS